MNRCFRHLGRKWDATSTGEGTGVATGYTPRPDRWTGTFRDSTGPSESSYEAHVGSRDLQKKISEEELKRVLERGLIRGFLRCHEAGTLEEISERTGIPVDSLRKQIELMLDVKVDPSDLKIPRYSIS